MQNILDEIKEKQFEIERLRIDLFLKYLEITRKTVANCAYCLKSIVVDGKNPFPFYVCDHIDCQRKLFEATKLKKSIEKKEEAMMHHCPKSIK